MIAITEKIVSPINEAASANRCSLIGLIIDDATSAQLLAVARRHCKLALEHGKAITTAVRRGEKKKFRVYVRCVVVLLMNFDSHKIMVENETFVSEVRNRLPGRPTAGCAAPKSRSGYRTAKPCSGQPASRPVSVRTARLLQAVYRAGSASEP
ncbi:hypothetical protein ABH899_003039 [Paenibacillus sp. RC84]